MKTHEMINSGCFLVVEKDESTYFTWRTRVSLIRAELYCVYTAKSRMAFQSIFLNARALIHNIDERVGLWGNAHAQNCETYPGSTLICVHTTPKTTNSFLILLPKPEQLTNLLSLPCRLAIQKERRVSAHGTNLAAACTSSRANHREVHG